MNNRVIDIKRASPHDQQLDATSVKEQKVNTGAARSTKINVNLVISTLEGRLAAIVPVPVVVPAPVAAAPEEWGGLVVVVSALPAGGE